MRLIKSAFFNAGILRTDAPNNAPVWYCCALKTVNLKFALLVCGLSILYIIIVDIILFCYHNLWEF